MTLCAYNSDLLLLLSNRVRRRNSTWFVSMGCTFGLQPSTLVVMNIQLVAFYSASVKGAINERYVLSALPYIRD